MSNRWTSRKFLTMVAVVIADIIIGLGYNLEPELIVALATSLAGLWIIVEGIIDVFRARIQNNTKRK